MTRLRLHQIADYARLALSLIGIYVFATLVVHLIALALLHNRPILGAIKGDVATT
jgi:hypothetical protein